MLESFGLEEDACGGAAGAEEVWAIAGTPKVATNKIAERDVVVHDMNFIVLFSPFAYFAFRQIALLYACLIALGLPNSHRFRSIAIKSLKTIDLFSPGEERTGARRRPLASMDGQFSLVMRKKMPENPRQMQLPMYQVGAQQGITSIKNQWVPRRFWRFQDVSHDAIRDYADSRFNDPGCQSREFPDSAGPNHPECYRRSGGTRGARPAG